MKDEAIIELYFARAEEAIRETELSYGQYCRSLAYGILRNHEDAEETVNDAYLKTWASIPPQRPANLKGFLGRITRQLSLNRLEKNTAAKRGGGTYALALDELAECIPGGNGEDLADLTALRDVLNRFLYSLGREQKNATGRAERRKSRPRRRLSVNRRRNRRKNTFSRPLTC